jgi:phosphoribosylformimino-5-aminoimidazole carboxamide ribotide isomerase
MIIIPAIDIMNGKCVRLTQGDFSQQKTYSENPLEMAQAFEEAGLQHLHLVDLDGAKAGVVKHWDMVESIVANTKLKVDFGGGVKTEAEINRLLDLGVSQINIGSYAHRNPEVVKAWLKNFGTAKIILSADSNNEMLAVAGWQNQTAVPLMDFIGNYIDAGLQFATCTDIAKDGMMLGPNTALYEKILAAFPALKLIASGGVNSIGDLQVLNSVGCYGCIIGKAIYEGTISLAELKDFESPSENGPSTPKR